MTVLWARSGHASPPDISRYVAELERTSETACDFPVRWEITAHITEQTFYDNEGNPKRIALNIREPGNRLTNLATDYTITEKPLAFHQVIDLDTGTIANSGLYVHVNLHPGGPRLVNVGRIVVDLSTNEILLEAGDQSYFENFLVEHREQLSFFCDVLRGP